MNKATNEMLHILWTKAVHTTGYDKKEWQHFEQMLNCHDKSQLLEPERKIVGYKLIKEYPSVHVGPIGYFVKIDSIYNLGLHSWPEFWEPIYEFTEDELWEEVYSIVAYLSATKDTKIKRLKQRFKITKS